MKWINPETGQLERRPPGLLHSHLEDYDAFDPEVLQAGKALMEKERSRIPASIQRLLGKSARTPWDGEAVKASSVGWRDLLTPRRVLISDGVQVLNSAAEALMVPDFTFAADYLEVGDALKYTLFFDISTIVTTPGTVTFRLRWGGLAGTPILAASGAYAPDVAVQTTKSGCIEYYLVCRTTGATGTIFCMGRMAMNNVNPTSVATIGANLQMALIPTSAPAVATSADTTIAKALSPTVQFSSATATVQLTNHLAFLESLN